MNQEERAELVRAYRVELKQSRRGLSPDMDNYLSAQSYDPASRNSRQRIERARTRSRFQRPRQGESNYDYIVRTAEGGDESYGRAAARWDLRRRRGTSASKPWDEGYTNYDGWAERARLRANRR